MNSVQLSSVIIVENARKRCSKCKVSQARTEENFARNKAKADGYDNYCKPCRAVATRIQYHKDRNPHYYNAGKDQQPALLKRILESYDKPHLRIVSLLTRERHQHYKRVLQAGILEFRNKEPLRAKILARHYKTLHDVSPWRVEIQFPDEWRALSKWMRLAGELTLYQWIRCHYEVQEAMVYEEGDTDADEPASSPASG